LVRQLFCIEDRSGPFVDVFRASALDAGYVVEVRAPEIGDPRFNRFKSVYRHLSVNSAAFELACFYRYFAVRATVKLAQRFIICDSDLVVQCGPEELPEEIREFTTGLVGSVGITGGVLEKDISPHFSIWSTELLQDFCDFLIHAYEMQGERLQSLYSDRRKTNPRASISDMTLLQLWVQQRSVPFLNSNQIFGDLHVDHNISLRECVGRQFRTFLGRKSLRLAKGKVGLIDIDGRPIRAALLHLQGRYKLVAEALYRRQRFKLIAGSAYIALGRRVRSSLQK